MAETPDYLTLKEHRDSDHVVERAARWVLIACLTAVAVAAFARVLGQTNVRHVATAPSAGLQVDAPTRLRGGLYFQARFVISARDDIRKATLVLDPGWTEQLHINTIEPAPVGESSRGGKLALDMGHVAADDRLVLYMQFQVNPTNVGSRSQDVELYDDTELLARVDRVVTVLP
jgi:hypothetical protein